MIRILPQRHAGSATAANCRHVCTAQIKETPGARSFAIQVRNGGRGD
jgi:hypothetical protein